MVNSTESTYDMLSLGWLRWAGSMSHRVFASFVWCLEWLGDLVTRIAMTGYSQILSTVLVALLRFSSIVPTQSGIWTKLFCRHHHNLFLISRCHEDSLICLYISFLFFSTCRL